MASVLDEMTSAITTRKDEKAATLTPVGMERQTIPASFPNDMPKEVMLEAIRDIGRIIKNLQDAQSALALAATGNPATPSFEALPTQREVERAADAKFADSYKQKQIKAQESAFTALSRPIPPDTGWRCKCDTPDVITLESNKGRVYNTCKSCKDFERP
jgi:polyribonucleotide nucleotidyltransferase